MGRTQNAGGDSLARGAVRFQFHPAEGVSEEKWNDIFADYDPEEFKNAPEKSRLRSGDTHGDPAGDASLDAGETEREPITR